MADQKIKTPPKPKPEGYTFGRPTKYLAEYCDEVIRMGGEGYSVVEMCAEIGVSRTTLENEWPQAYPDFSLALASARLASQAWWEGQGRKGILADRFQAALYSRSMAARFPADWRETKNSEITGKDGGSIKVEQEGTATELLASLAAATLKANKS